MVSWRAHRRWLWRLNGVLALVVISGWAWWFANPYVPEPLPDLELQFRPVRPQHPEGVVAWDDLVQEASQRYPWGEHEAEAPPPPEPTVPGRVPLTAHKVTLWYYDPTGPDAIVLRSKDPAHPAAYYPTEIQPDRDVVLEEVVVEERYALLRVRRDDETFTYRFPRRPPITSSRVRILPADPTHGRSKGATDREFDTAEFEDSSLAASLKTVPYFGRDGAEAGRRVTGVRPGSWFDEVGLRPGDVIERVGDERVRSRRDLRTCFASSSSAGHLEVLRIDEGRTSRHRLGS